MVRRRRRLNAQSWCERGLSPAESDAVAACPSQPTVADVDVVIDWPAQQPMPVLLTTRTDQAKPLTWIQIRFIAGPDHPPASFLRRAANRDIRSAPPLAPVQGISTARRSCCCSRRGTCA
ncbi:hypothetical protein GCM10022214_25840 [Actinomadura miaoliensis]|uniref:Uncharacterized protein n=1 Tax=Actinomadura miaoliensis TaxID=430685 RepID=A0ABP7VKT3_9ACTN